MAKTEDRHLTKSSSRWIAGVCAGIADYYGCSRWLVRTLWVLLTVLSIGFPGFAVYMVLAVLLPPPPDSGRKFRLDDFRAQ